MVKNEVGTEIPEHIVKKAIEMGCRSTKYIYKDGEYGGKFPASNIGGGVAKRFGNWDNVEKHKIYIEDDWVVFESPTYSEQGRYYNYKRSPSQVLINKRGEPKIIVQGDYISGQKSEVKDSVMVRSNIISSDKKVFKICPYCGEKLEFPETPKFCPFCEKQILK